MTSPIFEVWEQFRSNLKRYSQAYSLLNPGCPVEQIRAVEQKTNFKLPPDLTALLSLNNGQTVGEGGIKNGIFKSVSGWDVYKRHAFLGIDEIAVAYQTFISDPVLLAEFGPNEIPFSAAGSPNRFSEAFCIHQMTGTVSLIWTEYPDPINPPEWQVQKFFRADSLFQFIAKQIQLYQ